MKLHELAPGPGAKKKVKRIGRGHGSGHGKTSCKGHKGQKARSGGVKKAGFEGGQMPLQRRLPKRGFTNIFKKEYILLNLDKLSVYTDNEVVDYESLIAKKIIKRSCMETPIKVLGKGELKNKLSVSAHKFSQSAKTKIEAAGGTVTILKA